MSDPEEGKPDLETCWPLPSNEPRSADCGKTSGNPAEKEVQHDSKSGHRGKTIRILKVVLKRSDELPRMKPFQCKQCGESLEDKSAYVKHLKSHARGRPTRCMVCGENFSKKSSLVLHQQSHAKGKPFMCNECGKTFSHRSSLVIHSKIHTQKKANGNRNIGSVKKHMGKKPYRCLECKKMFVLYKNFLKHQKVHERDVPPSPKPAFPSLEEKSEAEAQPAANLGLMFEEMRKMRENVDMLLLNQQSQLQVLQGIQKQLSIILPGNDLINSNVYSLGLLLGQQAGPLGLSSSPLLLNPSILLPEEARPFSSHVFSQPPLTETVLSCLRSGAHCPAP